MPPITNISVYKFTPLHDLEALRARLRDLSTAAGLKGTILLSPEGINLFVAGHPDQVEALLAALRTISGLEDLAPKVSGSAEQPFNRMLVKIKKEIIAFGVEGIDPSRRPTPKLPAPTLKRWLDEGRAVTLIDTRNDYEVRMGTFRGAIPACEEREFHRLEPHGPGRARVGAVDVGIEKRGLVARLDHLRADRQPRRRRRKADAPPVGRDGPVPGPDGNLRAGRFRQAPQLRRILFEPRQAPELELRMWKGQPLNLRRGNRGGRNARRRRPLRRPSGKSPCAEQQNPDCSLHR